MHIRSAAAAALIALLPGTALGQSVTAGRSEGAAIVVTGKKTPDGKEIPMSDWHVAETGHVLVFSKGDTQRLARVAHNLEKLHFLLSMLFDRVDAPDDTIKLSVTLIGDRADFNHLGLDNLRWQPGPYPRAFPTEVHYDPREDGAVLATTYTDHQIVLEPGMRLTALNIEPQAPLTMPGQASPGGGSGANSLAGPGGGIHDVKVNETAYPMSAEGRIYAGFAQHYLLTYFPNAYPRWYLEGFGEIFATMAADRDGAIEYGRAPEGFREVMDWYGRYPLRNVLNGKYLEEKFTRPDWTPYHAWALAHLLFFSDEWKEPLNRYLAAVARGAGAEEATEALGDIDLLQRQLATYRGRKVPLEVLSYPPDQTPPPDLRRLTKGEATLVRGRLELGARVQIAGAAGDASLRQALADRDAWLKRLRDNAARYNYELEAQLLLAEAECRSGNNGECRAAADRALAIAPDNASAMAWKGIALVQQAATGQAAARNAELQAGRKLIVQANRADPDAVQPLLGYYRSFAEAGEAPPPVALVGLMKVVDSVPAAPKPRVMLGESLARQGEAEAARQVLRPVAIGPYRSPEQAEAEAILRRLGG